jgi:GDP-L-fucose synthase
LREFLHVDDCADALVFLMQRYSGDQHVNVGYGQDISIGALARLVAEVVGFTGRLRFDPSAPDGAPRKLMDSRRLRQLGWTPKIPLRDGVQATYQWYLSHAAAGSGRAAMSDGGPKA